MRLLPSKEDRERNFEFGRRLREEKEAEKANAGKALAEWYAEKERQRQQLFEELVEEIKALVLIACQMELRKTFVDLGNYKWTNLDHEQKEAAVDLCRSEGYRARLGIEKVKVHDLYDEVSDWWADHEALIIEWD